MNPKEDPATGVQMLLALRKETDALQVISEYLKVKEMGPSDHIRTKHEAKAFIETGDVKTAEDLMNNARKRRAQHQTESIKQSQQQQSRMSQ